MAEIAKWGGHIFEVSPSLIKSITELQIRGSSETEDSESGDKYTKRKAGNPKEISLTVKLNAYVGANVRNEAMTYVDEATAGKKDYFFVSGSKLVSCQMMLCEATISNVVISNNGTWISADAMLVMRQADGTQAASAPAASAPASSGSSGSSGSWNKSSVNSTPAKQSSSSSSSSRGTPSTWNRSNSSSSSSSSSTLKKAQDSIRDTTSAAKSASKKTTPHPNSAGARAMAQAADRFAHPDKYAMKY